MESIVRLASLRISNIKNVRDGQIIMPNACRKQMSYKNAEVLGLYGQNGSGKTAIIDTLYYLQSIMVGEALDDEIGDYIDASCDHAEIVADFNIFTKTIIYEASYKVVLQKIEKGVEIVRETLSCAVNEDDSRSNKTVFMDYLRSDKEVVFAPKKRLDEVVEANKEKHGTTGVFRAGLEKVKNEGL